MKTKVMKLASLTEYEDNARINDDTVIALRSLMDRFGYLVPMVVTEKGAIVAGHARFKAMKAEGVESATCVVIKGDEKADEFRILDNKIHELSSWDKEKLNVELRGLESVRGMFSGLNDDHVEMTGLTKVTAGSVAHHKDKLKEQYSDLSTQAADQRVRVKCGGCNREFQVKRWELNR